MSSNRRVLSLGDINSGPKYGSEFKPHIVVPIPELSAPGETEPPCVYLISPSAGRVLSIGAAAKINKTGKAEDMDASMVETNSKLMVDLVLECARNADGTPLCSSVEEVQALPVFVFNRIVKAVNALMMPGEAEAAGKDSATTPGSASPTN